MIDEAPVIICGFPSPAEDYREDNLDFNEYLSINKASVYVLRARGNSMTGAGIYPGDIIIVDKAKEPRHGSLVVAEIDGAFTLKRLLIKGHIILHPENPDYNDIILKSSQELVVFGVVTAIVRKYDRTL
jgi:SOS-response transcriptional repressors (RecA-mediated autopeptidases)